MHIQEGDGDNMAVQGGAMVSVQWDIWDITGDWAEHCDTLGCPADHMLYVLGVVSPLGAAGKVVPQHHWHCVMTGRKVMRAAVGVQVGLVPHLAEHMCHAPLSVHHQGALLVG